MKNLSQKNSRRALPEVLGVVIGVALMLGLCSFSWAQEEAETEEQKKLIEIQSQIDWPKLELNQFLDFRRWKNELVLRDQIPDWRERVEYKRRKEKMGIVIDSVGDVRHFRDGGHSIPQSNSTIKEGDEISTFEGGHLWIYLIDGSLIRLSPFSSLTMKEINIGKEKIFFQIRINNGHVSWLHRHSKLPEETALRETDTLFFPLAMHQANFPIPEASSANGVEDLLDNSWQEKLKYQKLKLQFDFNNQGFDRFQTEAFLVFPNGTLHTTNSSVEFVVLRGNSSYLKIKNKEEDAVNNFFFRGYDNKANEELTENKWYQVEERGRSISEYSNGDREFGMSEFITKRIPTILMAREILLEKESLPLFRIMKDAFALSFFNYRFWNDSEELNEFAQRLSFLKEYTRREETTGLASASKVRENLKQFGEKIVGENYSEIFYHEAIQSYFKSGEKGPDSAPSWEVLNSTKKEFWNYVNNRR
jgi:hypothetical protein